MTGLRQELQPLDAPSPHIQRFANSAQRFMKLKGYHDLEPMGCIEVDESCVYFYFLLPDQTLIELEVVHHQEDQKYTRKVTAFITSVEQVQQLLAG